MKKSVHQYIKSLTQNDLSMDANSVYISDKLNVSRNLISQYLNEMYNEEILIKINTRPVIFFDKNIIEENLNTKIEQKLFKSIEDLKYHIKNDQVLDFEKLVGVNGSLSSIVEQCKAAISYPPNGLPILLNGPTGSGKSYMAQLMYEYAVNNNLIKSDKKFLIVNCSEYANNPELLTANLFGHKKGAYTGADKDNQGLIKVADGGVLFLDEVHCLKAECQEKLFLFMDKGIYHMVGDNEKWYKSNVRLVFATTEDPEKVLLKTLLRRIPIIVDIPSLDERGVNERIQLIHNIFVAESKRIGKKIRISNLVYNILISTSFAGNIGNLKNIIQASCANALLQYIKTSEFLDIYAYNLPNNLFKSIMDGSNISRDNDKRMIEINKLKKNITNNRPIIKLNIELLNHYKSLEGGDVELDKYLKSNFDSINNYYEHTVFNKSNVYGSKIEYIQGITKKFVDIVGSKYGFKINNNDIISLSKYLDDYVRNNHEIKYWCENNIYELELINKYLIKHLHREHSIAMEIVEYIEINMDIELDIMVAIIITFNIKMFNSIIDINKKIGIIIAHGYSTASSIADAANKLLGQYIFDAIDMPLHVSTQVIIDKLNDYLLKLNNFEELVLLVDMGSLEEIYKGISNTSNSNIGIINNITTKLALEIGDGMQNNIKLEEILDKASENNKCTYQIFNNKLKEKVILCSCASGMGTAEKLKQIIENSLPKDINIKVLTHDYNELISNDSNKILFDKYNVLCIIGTLNPNTSGVKFIPIEDLITNKALEEMYMCFEHYLSEDEINIFKQNILKNFSLSNIIDNLTILNPSKILEHVATSVERLEKLLNIKLNNNICVGLYIHISCLIERLITKQEIETYLNIDEFKKENKSFIESVKEAFSVVEEYYRVEIPVEEIGYIYDYIKNR